MGSCRLQDHSAYPSNCAFSIEEKLDRIIECTVLLRSSTSPTSLRTARGFTLTKATQRPSIKKSDSSSQRDVVRGSDLAIKRQPQDVPPDTFSPVQKPPSSAERRVERIFARQTPRRLPILSGFERHGRPLRSCRAKKIVLPRVIPIPATDGNLPVAECFENPKSNTRETHPRYLHRTPLPSTAFLTSVQPLLNTAFQRRVPFASRTVSPAQVLCVPDSQIPPSCLTRFRSARTHEIRRNGLLPTNRPISTKRKHNLLPRSNTRKPLPGFRTLFQLPREARIDFEEVIVRDGGVRVSECDGDC